MSPEQIVKLQPDRTLYLRGFTGIGSAASLYGCSPIGFNVAGVFRDMADFCVLVADQTLRSVRDTVRLRTVLGDREGKRRNILVVNRHGEGGRHAVTLREIEHVVETKPKSVIPFQPTLFTTVAGAVKIAAGHRGKFTDAVAGLALELSGRPPDRRRWWRAEK